MSLIQSYLRVTFESAAVSGRGDQAIFSGRQFYVSGNLHMEALNAWSPQRDRVLFVSAFVTPALNKIAQTTLL